MQHLLEIKNFVVGFSASQTRSQVHCSYIWFNVSTQGQWCALVYPQVTTLFSIKIETVASVDSVGLITARVPGKSTITGTVEATDPQSGHTIVFSKVRVLLSMH